MNTAATLVNNHWPEFYPLRLNGIVSIASAIREVSSIELGSGTCALTSVLPTSAPVS